MLIQFGTFTKEINSTMQVDIDELTSINCELKDNVSILNPVIRLHDSVYNTEWNYCYIPKWERFYFLHDAVITPGMMWEIELAIDVLASWKSAITSASAYVSRSASDYNIKIPDSTWSHTTDNTISHTSIDVGFNSLGSFLLFTASDDAQLNAASIPALSVYSLSAIGVKSLCNYLFSNDFISSALGGVETVEDKLAQTFFNPFQYVVKCMWIPVLGSDLNRVDKSSISFGWWEYQTAAHLLSGHKWTNTFRFTPGTYTDWTDRDASWNHITLYVPGFGQIEISTDYAGRQLTGEIILDLATGQGALFIKTDGGSLVASATGQLGADVQLTSLYEDVIGDLGNKTTAIKAGAGAIAGGFRKLKEAVGTALSSAASPYGVVKTTATDLSTLDPGGLASDMVKGAQAALQPTLSTIGANGTRAITDTETNAILTVTKYSRYDDIHERLGGMCNKVLNLGDLSGYTEVVNPHISCGATSGEITMINNFLSGGFYLE